MTPEHVKKVLKECAKLCHLNGIVDPQRWSSTRCPDFDPMLGHVLFMVEEATKFVDAGEMEKAMRWLGFIQGVLWSVGVETIDTFKQMNKAP